MKRNKFLIALLLVIFLTGCSAKTNPILDSGKVALEKHDYKEAMELLSSILDEDNSNDEARAMYMQAMRMSNVEKYEARQDYDEAIEEIELIEKIRGGSSTIKSEATDKKKELIKINDEYKKDQEERKENAKSSASKDKYKVEQNALKENVIIKDKEEKEKEEEQEEKEEESNKEDESKPDDTSKPEDSSTITPTPETTPTPQP